MMLSQQRPISSHKLPVVGVLAQRRLSTATDISGPVVADALQRTVTFHILQR